MSKKNGKKSIFQEFKEFTMRGNVIDLAIGVIIGGAFSAIVSSLVADIITPVLGLVTGGINFSQLYLPLDGGAWPNAADPTTSLEAAKEAGRAVMTYGNFIQAIINFIMIALVLFIIVKVVKASNIKAKKEAAAAEAEAAAKKAEEERIAAEEAEAAKALVKICPYCLTEIHVNATRCPHCTSQL